MKRRNHARANAVASPNCHGLLGAHRPGLACCGVDGLAYTRGYAPAPTPEPGEEVDEDMKRAAQEPAREVRAFRVR